MSDPNLSRERDARETIRNLLIETQVYDAVYHGAFPRDDGRSSGDRLVATIDPMDSTTFDPYSGGDGPFDYVECRIAIEFIARERDGVDCDAEVERLYATAWNVLTGSNLGGFAMPAWSKMGRAVWQRAIAPGRRLSATYVYRYLVDVSMNVDT